MDYSIDDPIRLPTSENSGRASDWNGGSANFYPAESGNYKYSWSIGKYLDSYGNIVSFGEVWKYKLSNSKTAQPHNCKSLKSKSKTLSVHEKIMS